MNNLRHTSLCKKLKSVKYQNTFDLIMRQINFAFSINRYIFFWSVIIHFMLIRYLMFYFHFGFDRSAYLKLHNWHSYNYYIFRNHYYLGLQRICKFRFWNIPVYQTSKMMFETICIPCKYYPSRLLHASWIPSRHLRLVRTHFFQQGNQTRHLETWFQFLFKGKKS